MFLGTQKVLRFDFNDLCASNRTFCAASPVPMVPQAPPRLTAPCCIQSSPAKRCYQNKPERVFMSSIGFLFHCMEFVCLRGSLITTLVPLRRTRHQRIASAQPLDHQQASRHRHTSNQTSTNHSPPPLILYVLLLPDNASSFPTGKQEKEVAQPAGSSVHVTRPHRTRQREVTCCVGDNQGPIQRSWAKRDAKKI
jgi:hypothetical protein